MMMDQLGIHVEEKETSSFDCGFDKQEILILTSPDAKIKPRPTKRLNVKAKTHSNLQKYREI